MRTTNRCGAGFGVLGQDAQQFGQQLGFLAARLPGVAEQLFELVDQQAQRALHAVQSCLDVVKHGASQREARLPGHDRIDRPARAWCRTERTGERCGEVAQRSAGRTRIFVSQVPPRLCCSSSRAARRPARSRTFRARRAVDHDQVVAGEQVDDRIDHLLAAEEDPMLLTVEWPQARIGFGRQSEPRRCCDCGREAHAAGSASGFARPSVTSNWCCQPSARAGTRGTRSRRRSGASARLVEDRPGQIALPLQQQLAVIVARRDRVLEPGAATAVHEDEAMAFGEEQLALLLPIPIERIDAAARRRKAHRPHDRNLPEVAFHLLPRAPTLRGSHRGR